MKSGAFVVSSAPEHSSFFCTQARGALVDACLFAIAIADVILIASWASGRLPATFAILLHVALACVVWLLKDVRKESAFGAIATLSILVMGPLGAVGSVFLKRRMDRSRDAVNDTRVPDRRIHNSRDLATDICNEVDEGRAYVSGQSALRRFSAVLSDGEMTDKQALLGTISQHFDADHMPNLRSALTSEMAPVRVSAAAVFAKLRENSRRSLRAMETGAGVPGGNVDTAAASTRARVLANAARSGLVGEAEGERALKYAVDLLLAERPSTCDFDDSEVLLCDLLLQSGRHEDVEARLESHAGALPPSLNSMLLRSRMRSRQYGGIAALAGMAAAASGRDAIRRKRPLIATNDQPPMASRRDRQRENFTIVESTATFDASPVGEPR